jgi:hypothetical protein
MRQTHIGGEKVFVDFAGDTIDIFAAGERNSFASQTRRYWPWNEKEGYRADVSVAASQQFFCSFDGTAVLIRPLRLAMQVCEHRGGRGHF